MTLIPTMKQRLAMPTDLVDLSGIDTLRGVALNGDRLRIGAFTPHAHVARSEVVQSAIPGLAQLAGLIGGQPGAASRHHRWLCGQQRSGSGLPCGGCGARR